MLLFRVAGFNQCAIAYAPYVIGYFYVSPVANTRHEVYPVVDELRQDFARMLSFGKAHDKRHIDDFFVKRSFLIPLMGACSVSMVAGEDDDCVSP